MLLPPLHPQRSPLSAHTHGRSTEEGLLPLQPPRMLLSTAVTSEGALTHLAAPQHSETLNHIRNLLVEIEKSLYPDGMAAATHEADATYQQEINMEQDI